MGRKKWFETPDKYPNSINYVLSNNTVASGVGFGGLTELKRLMEKHPDKDVYIIGGADIFEMYMYLADQIIMTVMKIDYRCDEFFPILNENYEITSCKSDMFSQEENCFYERIHYMQSVDSMHPEYKFLDACKDLLENGESTQQATSIYSKSMIFDTGRQFPLFTCFKTDFRKVVAELTSALNGNGEIGFNWRFFGAKFSHLFEQSSMFSKKEVFGGVDQLKELDSLLVLNPDDKNLMLTCYNPIDRGIIENTCQFYIVERYMSLIVTIPKIHVFKINEVVAFYSFLLYIMSSRGGKTPDKLFLNFGSVFVKEHQRRELEEIVKQVPRPFPVLILDRVVRYKKLEDLNGLDFTMVGYTHSNQALKKIPFAI
jgi:thymidylate synthase